MTTLNNITNLSPAAEGAATYTIHTDAKAAALLSTSAQRTISYNWRKPAKLTLAVNVSAEPWNQLAAVPEQYRGLLERVLDNAAETILKRYAEAFSLAPSTIPCDLLTADAILGEAVGNNSEWMSKEELTQAWESSATRNRMLTDPRYTSNKHYRIAVSGFADMILKLAGKTARYTPEELDAMLAKLDAPDLDTALGNFIARRVEMLRNKPAAPAVDLSLL